MTLDWMQSVSLDKRSIESIDRMKTVRYSVGQNIPCEGRHTWRNIGNGAHRRRTREGRTEDQISPPSPLLPPPTYLAPRPIQKWHPYPRNWGKDTPASWPAIKGSVQSYHTATNRPQRMQMLMVALWQRKRDPILPPIILFTTIELCLCR